MARRFFRHGELPLVILALLEREPMHGYQVLGELGRVFGDAYQPSAGSVYPAIRTLRDNGLVGATSVGRAGATSVGRAGATSVGRAGATSVGRRSVYSLTDLGHQTLRARGEELGALELRTGARVRLATSVDGAIDRFAMRAHLLAPLLDPRATEQLLEETTTRLERLTDAPGSL
jgi:DNA-binding PadR family transcriptional regulator